MSELQIALLAIGAGVIVAVYVYGWWQQRQFRRKFGASFRTTQGDALYGSDAPVTVPSIEVAFDATTSFQAESHSGDATAGKTDAACALLDARSDFIIELKLKEPSPASVLGGFWQRKFDFGKPVQVCGIPHSDKPDTGKSWERAIAEGTGLYTRLRIALQLVDRGGAISVTRLGDFRDLVAGIAQQIMADATIPELDGAHRAALELDEFCAGVDQMVGINLVQPGERPLFGGKIAQAAAMLGMTLETDGAFHLLDARRHSLFSLVNRDNQPFQHHTLGTFTTRGVTLLMDVPRVEDPVNQFDVMLQVARRLSNELQVNMVDDNLAALSELGLERIRDRIAEVEQKMRERGLPPGSAQARRLFA